MKDLSKYNAIEAFCRKELFYDSNLSDIPLQTIPTTAGIYLICIGCDSYIGKAKSLRSRIRTHIRCCNNRTEHIPDINDALQRNHGAYCIYVLEKEVETSVLDDLESLFISSLNPSLNIRKKSCETHITKTKPKCNYMEVDEGLAMMCAQFTLMEMRLMVVIGACVNSYMSHATIEGKVIEVSFPMRSVCKNASSNEDICKSAEHLLHKTIVTKCNILYGAFVNYETYKCEGKSWMKVSVSKTHLGCIYHSGFKFKASVECVSHCQNRYSLRIYLLLCKLKSTKESAMEYSEMRRILGCDIYSEEKHEFVIDKYPNVKSFNKYIMSISKQELHNLQQSAISDISFDYNIKSLLYCGTNEKQVEFEIHS